MRTLGKLRGRSRAELRTRGAQWAYARAERLEIALLGRRRSRPSRWRAQMSSQRAHTSSWLAERPTLTALQGPNRCAGIAQALERDDAATMAELRRRSATLRQGTCSLLGYEQLAVGNPPRWHVDASSGRKAPLLHWSRINYLDPAIAGDHKVLWETNRHQYLIAPALCWLVDKDVEQFRLITAHIDDWLIENPRSIGVNWSSSLEVAYRAITWCWIWWLTKEAPWDPDLIARMADCLEWHALHVEHYLSTYFSPNTHLTGEALGLFYVGTVLPESPLAKRWRTTGARILESCADRHVLADGIYFEQATQYQRYTAEIYLHYMLLAQSTGQPISAMIRNALLRQFELLRSIVSSAGQMPLLGDDDGGYLLPLDCRPPDDIAGLLLAGATALDRPDLVVAGVSAPSMSYWLLGPSHTRTLTSADAVQPAWRDMHFASGGLVVMRDGWHNSSAVSVLDAGPHGALSCGHAHADALAMTLTLGPTPVLVDRGTATYVGADRNAYRSTSSHNTLEFEGESSVLPGDPFQWGAIPKRATAGLRCCRWLSLTTARAEGHRGTQRPSTHDRVVIHQVDGAWVVIDQGARAECINGVVRWQFASGMQVAQESTSGFHISDSRGAPVMRVIVLPNERGRLSTRLLSPRLGCVLPAPLLEVQTGPELRANTLLLPATPSTGELPAILNAQAGPDVIEWIDDLGHHRLCWTRAAVAQQGPPGWRAQGALLWLTQTRPVDAQLALSPDRVIAIGMQELTTPSGQNLLQNGRPDAGNASVFERRTTQWEPVEMAEPHRGQE